MRNLTLQIDGMKCNGCASAVRETLEDVPGVERVAVSLEDGRARVVGADDLEEAALVRAVDGAGYGARIVAGA